MTKRKGADEQLWLLVGEDGTVQTVKKDRFEEEAAEEFIEDEIGDDDDDDDADDADDGDLIELLNKADPESVHNEVYIDQSQLVEEHEHDEIHEEGSQVLDTGSNNDSKMESTTNNVEEDPAESTGGIKWSDKATYRLLDLIEQVTAKESSVPGRSDRVWIRIAQDMKPFHFTADECHKKLKYMSRTYRSALERKARNMPYHWRYFHRMRAILGEIPPKKRNVTGLKAEVISEPNPVVPEPSTSTSAICSTVDDEPEEDGLSKFDQLLKKKREMQTEVRQLGEILHRHIDEAVASTIRREERENDMVTLVIDLKNQEQKKLDLFRKLLDKLWYEFKFMLCLNEDNNGELA